MRSHSCPKRQSQMVEGFVADEGYGTKHVSKWIEGAPEKSFWTGLKIGKRRKIEIRSWRCRNCGFLEHYAPA